MSGAVAILRLCEELGQDIDAAFVVSACATHLGDDNEKASGKNLLIRGLLLSLNSEKMILSFNVFSPSFSQYL